MSRPYSFSRIMTYLRCPAWYNFTYIEGMPELRQDTTALGSEVHRAIAEYILHGKIRILASELKPSQVEMANSMVRAAVSKLGELGEVVAVEQKFALDNMIMPTEFDDQDALIRGIIDLITLKEGGLCVWDWKTGKEKKSEALQLKLYLLAVSNLYNADVISAGFIYLPSGHIELIINDYNYSDIENELLEIISKIESDKKFNPKPGSHCFFCPHTTSCPIGENLDFNLSSEVGLVKALEKLMWLESIRKTIREAIVEYVENFGPIETKGWVVTLDDRGLKISKENSEEGGE